MTERETLKKWLDESSNIVFFGGAGVSTESHIPDFRSTDGLYNQQYDHPPETILSHSFYVEKPEADSGNKMLFPNAEPNRAHKALARLEKMGKLKAVVTQNIDGLHQEAGSREVLELHGSVLRNYCTRCGKFYGLDAILNSTGVPKCTCGGTIKPDVVLYEERSGSGDHRKIREIYRECGCADHRRDVPSRYNLASKAHRLLPEDLRFGLINKSMTPTMDARRQIS